MRLFATLATILILVMIHVSCSGGRPYHKDPLPDPSAYRAHFPDMDANGDDLVNWTEFKQHYPNGDTRIFKALDLNHDDAVDHDEWHKFKKSHGH